METKIEKVRERRNDLKSECLEVLCFWKISSFFGEDVEVEFNINDFNLKS